MTFVQPPIETNALVGSTPQILYAEFGQPVLRRVDGIAQVWLYQSQNCGLNLILYPDSAGIPRVAIAAPIVAGSDPIECGASLQRAHVTAALEHPAAS